MMYNYGYYQPYSLFNSLFGWLFVFLIIFLIIRLARGGGRRFHFHDFHRDSAMDIIREKYAKGEMTKEEFETKKKDLSS